MSPEFNQPGRRMSGPVIPAEATGVIVVDLAQLGANWRALRDLVAPAECAAVVKADAYGLGAGEVIPALWRAGCRTFFIATIGEARQARALAPEATLYVLDGLLPATAAQLAQVSARPVLSSLPEVREWAEFARQEARRLPCGLHIDSGLNRLGLVTADVAALAEDADLMAHLDTRLVMSHLASADDPDDPKNREQLAAFSAARARLPAAAAALSASDGLMLGSDFHFDLVRPGYALYGGQPSKGRTMPVAPVVTVRARVLQVREVPPGETIGYSATYRTETRRLVATIAAGYADGFARSSSASNAHPGGAVGYKGRLAPVLGRVSMDLITVDVTDCQDLGMARGDWVDLIGPGITLEDAGHRADTIGYEVLTRLGRRFHRIYTGSGG